MMRLCLTNRFFRFCGMCDVLRIPSSASSREGLVVGLLVGYIHVQACLDTTWYNLRRWIICRCTMIPIICGIDPEDGYYAMNICTVPLTLALCCILLSHIISKLRGFCNGHLCQRIDDFNSMAQDQETETDAKTETETEGWNLFRRM